MTEITAGGGPDAQMRVVDTDALAIGMQFAVQMGARTLSLTTGIPQGAGQKAVNRLLCQLADAADVIKARYDLADLLAQRERFVLEQQAQVVQQAQQEAAWHAEFYKSNRRGEFKYNTAQEKSREAFAATKIAQERNMQSIDKEIARLRAVLAEGIGEAPETQEPAESQESG